MNLEQIHRHWEEAGEKISLIERVTSTSRDPFLGILEEANILRHLRGDQNVLEVGCGDASHTIKYAQHAKFIWATDVAASLIKLAQQRAASAGTGNIEFCVGSVLDAGQMFRDMNMDCVISQRCLINLPSWEHQQEAILNIYELLKPGGVFLMTEGFQDELNNVNSLRKAVGLSEINVVSYNRNLQHNEFDAFINRYFTTEAVHDYGLYLFLSRVYHPLVVLPESPNHDSRLNEVASMLSTLVPISSLKKFSYNLFYVLKKK